MKAFSHINLGLKHGAWRLLSLLFLTAAFTGTPQEKAATNATPATENPPATQEIRIGISGGTWQGFNRNDATAAMSVWAKTVFAQKGISGQVKAIFYANTTELIHEMEIGAMDCANVTVDQFLMLPPQKQPPEVYVATSRGSCFERYLLIVHNQSDIHDLRALQGHKLLVQTGARSTMALTWLDATLASESLQKPEEFMTVTSADKPSRAILPVFFRQADACLVTSNAFEVAAELNPQLKTNLRVLAASPEIVTSVFFFCQQPKSEIAQQLEPAILTLHETPGGLQILTIFQSERMARISVSCLQSARQLIAERDRLRGQAAGSTRASQ